MEEHNRLFMKNHPIFTSIIIAIIAYLIVFYFNFSNFKFLIDSKGANDNGNEIAILTASATFLLAWIALNQLGSIVKNEDQELLLFISNRFGSEDIIKARKIIHQEFVQLYRINDITKNKYQESIHALSQKIVDMSKDQNTDFVYLLNFLDFLETLGLIAKNNNKKNHINEILGRQINFFYEVFRLYIFVRQHKESSASHFKNFEKLALDLKKCSK